MDLLLEDKTVNKAADVKTSIKLMSLMYNYVVSIVLTQDLPLAETIIVNEAVDGENNIKLTHYV